MHHQLSIAAGEKAISRVQRRRENLSTRYGFTLVELLVSMGVLSILMLVAMTALETTQRSWRETKSKVDQFREARIAFETITRNLSQATLNTYWDYFYAETQSNQPPSDVSVSPAGYVRQSELDFQILPAVELTPGGDVSHKPGHALFFQAPLGLSQSYRGLGHLLNARGYYVHFESNVERRPAFLPGGIIPVKHRYRLMEYRPPAESVAQQGDDLLGNAVYTQRHWYQQNLEAVSRPIADNILLLLFSAQVPSDTLSPESGRKAYWIAPGYRYNSRDVENQTPDVESPVVRTDGSIHQGTQHLLPPQVRVTLVAGEEDSTRQWLGRGGDAEALALSQLAEAPFEDAQHYERDLDRLKQYLNRQRVNYRVFTTTITLRNAAWDSSTY